MTKMTKNEMGARPMLTFPRFEDGISWRKLMLVAGSVALVMAAAAYLWKAGLIPKPVDKTFDVEIELPQQAGEKFHTQVRTIDLPRFPGSGRGATVKEIRLPSGKWIDCYGDCKTAFKAALPKHR